MTATLADQLALCDALQEAMLTANALDGVHASQRGGTYGAIFDALAKALTVTLEGEGFGPRVARRHAWDLIDRAGWNGESITVTMERFGPTA